MRAFAYRNGVIGFGRKLPGGLQALTIANAPKAILERAISACARHSYDGQTLLVPGIPEADNEDEAMAALLAFRAQVHKRICLAKHNPGAVVAKAVV